MNTRAPQITYYFSQLYAFPTESVNNSVQVVGVESRARLLAKLHPEPLELFQNVLDAPVALDAVVDELVQRLRHRVVLVAADAVSGEAAFRLVRFGDSRRDSDRG